MENEISGLDRLRDLVIELLDGGLRRSAMVDAVDDTINDWRRWKAKMHQEVSVKQKGSDPKPQNAVGVS